MSSPTGSELPPPPPSAEREYNTGKPSSNVRLFSSSDIPRRHHAATVSGPRPMPPTINEPAQADTASDAQSAHSDTLPARRRGLSVSTMLSGLRASPQANEDTVAMSRRPSAYANTESRMYTQQLVDMLDAVDPEGTLSDVQNSLFVPNLGGLFDRTRSLRLRKPPARSSSLEARDDLDALEAQGDDRLRPPPAGNLPPGAAAPYEKDDKGQPIRLSSESAVLPAEEEKPTVPPRVAGEYFVMPKTLVDGWDEWSDEEKAELDDYVRHLLHSRKERFRRSMRGFRRYVRTPLGAFITIYATLLTFWGAAWILFLIGWIGVGDRQDYFVEICDQILTALFCVVGIGLAPFRVYDTYHMYFIVKYHRLILRLRKARGYPPLPDENEIPETSGRPRAHLRHPAKPPEDCTTREQHEAAMAERYWVLTDAQYAKFVHHQEKFGRSHTFYRPHESVTHKAFPLDLMIVVILLLDFHSGFQIALGSLTWAISYHHDWKHKVTAVILSISITTNITAGLVISVGNKRTRKKEVVERLLRQAVTEEAIKRAGRHPERHPLPLGRTDSGHVALLPAPVPARTKSFPWSKKREDTERSRRRTNTDRSVAHASEGGIRPAARAVPDVEFPERKATP